MGSNVTMTSPPSLARRAAATRDGLVVALTVATGSLDAIAFLALGHVFVSVITGNLVLVGVGLGDHEALVAGHAAASVGGYVVGVAVGAAITGKARDEQPLWPWRVSLALLVEVALLGGFLAGWELSSGHPAGHAVVILLAVAAAALGLQSDAVNRLDVPGFSSTYLTSTLIRAVTDLVVGPRRDVAPKVAALAALGVGALIGAALLEGPRAGAPAFAVGVVGAVVVVAEILRRRGGLLGAVGPEGG